MGNDYLRINGISFFSIDSAIGRGGAWTSQPKRRLLPGDLSGDTGVDRKVNLPLIPLANNYGWAVKSIHSAYVLSGEKRRRRPARGVTDRRGD